MMSTARAAALISLACTLQKTAAGTVYGESAADQVSPAAATCGGLKDLYKAEGCCGNPNKDTGFQVVPKPSTSLVTGSNPCEGKKPTASAFDNHACMVDGVVDAAEQSGTNVTEGYTGMVNNTNTPIMTPYWQNNMCPVNVHWHLGAEHLSVGQYDENGLAPYFDVNDTWSFQESAEAGERRLGGSRIRKGLSCHLYNENEIRFTTEYDWKHCVGMHVGETYEVHWPHSAAGACGEPWQFQTPFYDGVFCKDGVISLDTTVSQIGVQAQVFTIVNDESYYYADLMRGMLVNGNYGRDMSYYSGSTTGTTRSNTMCSRYAPITWQVDRECHLISASSFDKMCADMKNVADDMSADLHPTGARELVADELAANDNQR